MKDPLVDLGMMLLSISLFFTISTIITLFTSGHSQFLARGLILVLITVITIFTIYLASDLYHALKENKE